MYAVSQVRANILTRVVSLALIIVSSSVFLKKGQTEYIVIMLLYKGGTRSYRTGSGSPSRSRAAGREGNPLAAHRTSPQEVDRIASAASHTGVLEKRITALFFFGFPFIQVYFTLDEILFVLKVYFSNLLSVLCLFVNSAF